MNKIPKYLSSHKRSEVSPLAISHDLELGGADFHPGRFKRGSEMFKWSTLRGLRQMGPTA